MSQKIGGEKKRTKGCVVHSNKCEDTISVNTLAKKKVRNIKNEKPKTVDLLAGRNEADPFLQTHGVTHYLFLI